MRVAGREQVDLFNVSAGTTLRVTPHVFRDRDQTRIKLLVNVEDGVITGRQVDQIPIVERSTVNTQALIAEGESLLIGGMVRETQTNSEDKVPGLGDVPVVGNLFKTKASGTTRVERMFLITPRMAGTRAGHAAGHARHAAQRPDAGGPASGQPDAGSGAAARPANVGAANRRCAGPRGRTAPAPATGAAPPAPAPAAPPTRASVVVDLDAMPAGAAPRAAPPPAASGGRTATPTRVSTSQTN